MAYTLGVWSEVGRLQHAIVPRPGLELAPLTSANCDVLMFDDDLWTEDRLHTVEAFLATALGGGR